MLLGGRVAEQLVFGAVTTGAANDLLRVAEITHAMVHEYGMGTAPASARALTDANVVSDVTRRIRDEEQQELAFEAERARAPADRRAPRRSSTRSPRRCSTSEVLDRAALDAIMRGVPQLAAPIPASPGCARSRPRARPPRARAPTERRCA